MPASAAFLSELPPMGITHPVHPQLRGLPTPRGALEGIILPSAKKDHRSTCNLPLDLRRHSQHWIQYRWTRIWSLAAYRLDRRLLRSWILARVRLRSPTPCSPLPRCAAPSPAASTRTTSRSCTRRDTPSSLSPAALCSLITHVMFSPLITLSILCLWLQ